MKRIITALGVGALLLGCSDSNYRDASARPQQPGAQQDFTTFVLSQFNATATTETAGPIAIDTTTFTFGDNDNPTAFSSVIATAP